MEGKLAKHGALSFDLEQLLNEDAFNHSFSPEDFHSGNKGLQETSSSLSLAVTTPYTNPLSAAKLLLLVNSYRGYNAEITHTHVEQVSQCFNYASG